MSTPMVVATIPATRPMMSEVRVPAISTATTSWPKLSVPRSRPSPGASYSEPTFSEELVGYTSPARPRSTIPATRTSAIQNLLEKLKERNGLLRGAAFSSVTGAFGVLMSLLPRLGRADARVDDAVGDLHQEVRHQHGEGDDERDGLDDRVVVLRDRGEQQRSHSRIVEHQLGDQRAAHEGADREGEAGDLREHRVAEDVLGDAPVPDAHGPGVVDVVAAELVDGHGA